MNFSSGRQLQRGAESAVGTGGEGEDTVVCRRDALDESETEADPCVITVDARCNEGTV